VAKIELTVGLDKKLSINYQSVGLSASIRVVKETDDLEGDLTTLKQSLEAWLDQQILESAKGLTKLNVQVKAAEDIPF
jgi:hypothetical protein